jgi:hypothetical protein
MFIARYSTKVFIFGFFLSNFVSLEHEIRIPQSKLLQMKKQA